MNYLERLRAQENLSKPARKLLARVSSSRYYYRWRPPAGRYMQELIDAGLVVHGGRVNQISAFWMPVGVTPFQMEKYPS